MKTVLILLFLMTAICCWPVRMIAQPTRGPLTVGQKVPELAFRKMLNYPRTSANLSDFKGKLVILDIWNTHCEICIRQFPKLRGLQQKFGSRIAIITVGIDGLPDGDIAAYIQKRAGTTYQLTLPTVVEKLRRPYKSNPLYALFPWNSMPYEIWISPDGIFKGVTDHTAVTEANIASLLANPGKSIQSRKKLRKIDCQDDFLIKMTADGGAGITGSAFSGYADSLDANWRLLSPQCDSERWRFININQPVIDFYLSVYKNFLPSVVDGPYLSRIKIDSSINHPFYGNLTQTLDLDDQAMDSFNKRNLFCYELLLPRASSKEAVFQRMIRDFDDYFHIKSFIETRPIACLALVSLPGKKDFISSPETETTYNRSISEDTLQVNNYPVKDFIRMINGYFPSRLILNETGTSFGLQLQLFGLRKDDLSSIKKALNVNGLDVKEVVREMEVLVLKDLR